MKNILPLIILLSMLTHAQQTYKIPFNSSGNSIELSLINKTNNEVKDVLIIAENFPAWIKFNNNTFIISTILPDEEQTALFAFSIEKEAPVNEETELNFVIKNNKGENLNKKILISVTPPEKFELFQNYPNPFNPATTISFTVPFENVETTLKVYDILGNEIVLLDHGVKPAGFYKFNWDATNFASGIYIYILETRSGEKENLFRKKMMLIK